MTMQRTSEPAFWDREAEAAVIKTCLRYPEAPGDAIAMGLKPGHFSEANALIIGAILAIADTDRRLSVATVTRYLTELGKLEDAGGLTALNDIWATAEAGSNTLSFYGAIVLERASVRREYELLRRHMDALTAPGADTGKEMAHFRSALLAEDAEIIRNDGPRSIREILDGGGYDRIGDWLANPHAIRGIRTGHAELDRLIGGLQAKRVSVIGAPTSVGKTQWMQHIGRFAALAGHSSLLLSTEMSGEDNAFRWTFQEAGLDRLRAERGGMSEKARADYMEAVYALAERPLHIWEVGGMDVARIRVGVRRMKARYGTNLVLLDMLNGLRVDIQKGENHAVAFGRVMIDLHNMAVGEDVHVMAAAHINRDADKRGGVLTKSDLRDSAVVEEWADQIIMLQPTDESGAPCTLEAAHQYASKHGRVPMLMNLCKNRHGSLGMLPLWLDWDAGGKFTEPDGAR